MSIVRVQQVKKARCVRALICVEFSECPVTDNYSARPGKGGSNNRTGPDVRPRQELLAWK